MLDDFGIPFEALPKLHRVRDLEQFEGPILSELRAESGAMYVAKWCARSEGVMRSLVVRSEQRPLAEYLAGRVTLLDLLTRPNDDVGFLEDRLRGERKHVQLVQVSTLPPAYLPKPTARHDETLRPSWDTTPQAFLLGDDWNARLISDLERLYLTVYAFNFFMAPESEKEVPPSALTYVLHGGYAYGTLFRVLRESIPRNDNARSTGVAAASPGVLTIASPTLIAERIITSLSAATKDQTAKAYDTLHAWSKLKQEKVDMLPPTAHDDLLRLSRMLTIDPSKILPYEYQPTQLLRAGKVVAAYYRQLCRLIEPDWSGAEFLAPHVVHEGHVPKSVYEDEGDDDSPW